MFIVFLMAYYYYDKWNFISYEVLAGSRKHVSVERGKIVKLYETYLGTS